MKRILSIQDISCVGKCSLTVALPIISAMGVECAVLPTAVLSTHTAFKGFTFHDLTCEMQPCSDHWAEQKLGFDAVYTGYLGSFEQIELVKGIFARFRTDGNMTVVDPAMADNGKLYPGFTEDFAAAMGSLCAQADVVLPNLTEASYILGIPYPGTDVTEEQIKSILRALAAQGAKYPALTGVALGKDAIGVMAYDPKNDRFFHYENERLPVSYHGTGDIFASAVVGGMMNGMTVDEALVLAVDYTLECIKETMKDPDSRWYGVNFESAVPMLVKRLETFRTEKAE